MTGLRVFIVFPTGSAVVRPVIFAIAALAVTAGPAAAEFGKAQPPSPSGFQKPKPLTGAAPGNAPYSAHPTPSYGSTYGASPSISKPRTYGSPSAAEPYKPYEPYKSQPGTSIFGQDSKKKR